MRDDLKKAKETVLRCNERGEKEMYIDKCDLTQTDSEILKRRFVLRQSMVQISMDMHMSKDSVQEHYRKAILVLYDIVSKYKK